MFGLLGVLGTGVDVDGVGLRADVDGRVGEGSGTGVA